MMVASASALSRLLACPGSAAVPQARTTSPAQDQGTRNHARYEEMINQGNLADLPGNVGPELAGHRVRAEVAVAYDVATGVGRELGVGLQRNYLGLAPFEIPGTADVLAIDPRRTHALIIDWKLYSDVDWVQLEFYALAVARAYRLQTVDVLIIYTGEGRERTERRTLDLLDLDAFAARLHDLHARVAAEQAKVSRNVLPDVSEGPHCRYCPALHVCPAKIALVKQVLADERTGALSLMSPLDNNQAAHIYKLVKAAKTTLDRLMAAVYARAREAPIPLGNGRMLGLTKKVGNERLDGDVVYNVIREQLGQDIADAAVIRTATKVRMHETIRNSKTELAILKEVRSRGGAAKSITQDVAEYALALADGEPA